MGWDGAALQYLRVRGICQLSYNSVASVLSERRRGRETERQGGEVSREPTVNHDVSACLTDFLAGLLKTCQAGFKTDITTTTSCQCLRGKRAAATPEAGTRGASTIISNNYAIFLPQKLVELLDDNAHGNSHLFALLSPLFPPIFHFPFANCLIFPIFPHANAD